MKLKSEQEKKERIRKYDAEYKLRPGVKERKAEICRKWKSKQKKVNPVYRPDYVITGEIVKKSCKTNMPRHGLYGTKIYKIFDSMKYRCYTLTSPNYKHYGARGICICDEWLNDLREFNKWAIENGYKDGLTIDRIDNDGNYEPSNCRWVTILENNRNRSTSRMITYNGVTLCLSEWAEKLDINKHTLWSRITRGIPIDIAFSKNNLSKGKNIALKSFSR